MDVKVGDKVLFAKYAGTELKIDGKKLLILRETDLLAYRRRLVTPQGGYNLWLLNNSSSLKKPAAN
jgi:hypothetical protein